MDTNRDHYGNEWRITENDLLEVTPPDAQTVVVWDRPDAPVTSVATDDHGFIWFIAGETVYFTNPRKVADTETPDRSEEQPGTSGTFTAVDSALLQGTPTRLQRSDAGMLLARCTSSDGTETVIELQVQGRDIGGPFTSGHTTDVTVSRDPTPANPDWETLTARLPYGTHDNHCTTANGRVFLAGGATHYYGYPATNRTHSELLAYDPADPDGEWTIVGRLPAGSVYSAMATLEDRIYVIGGGGGGNPLSAKCWTFDAASTSEATADRQSAPSLPFPRFGCVAAAANGRIWVVGGTGGTSRPNNKPLNDLLSIAPGESEWRIERPAPIPLPIATLTGCELDGVIYVLGGIPARFLAFDTATGKWDETLPNHPIGSQAAAMATHEGEIWVCGGGVTFDPEHNPDAQGDKRLYSRKTHAYSIANRGWREGPDLPCEQNWGAACSIDGRLLVVAGAHRSQSAGTYVFDNRVFAMR